MSHHEHGESGITDEAAVEGHDLIHNAEVEEQKAHGREALTQSDYGEEPQAGQKSSSGQEQGQKQKSDKHDKHDKSTMEKVKEALHMKK